MNKLKKNEEIILDITSAEYASSHAVRDIVEIEIEPFLDNMMKLRTDPVRVVHSGFALHVQFQTVWLLAPRICRAGRHNFLLIFILFFLLIYYLSKLL